MRARTNRLEAHTPHAHTTEPQSQAQQRTASTTSSATDHSPCDTRVRRACVCAGACIQTHAHTGTDKGADKGGRRTQTPTQTKGQKETRVHARARIHAQHPHAHTTHTHTHTPPPKRESARRGTRRGAASASPAFAWPSTASPSHSSGPLWRSWRGSFDLFEREWVINRGSNEHHGKSFVGSAVRPRRHSLK